MPYFTDEEKASIKKAVEAKLAEERSKPPVTHYIIKASFFGDIGLDKYTSDNIFNALETRNKVAGLESVSDYKYKIPANQIYDALHGILLDKDTYVSFEIVEEIRTPNPYRGQNKAGGRRRTRKTRRVKRKGTKAKKSRQSRQSRR